MELIPDILKINEKKAIKKICRFIRKIVKISSHKGIVVGISGGIDSALCAALSVEALGPKKVFGLLMPSSVSSKSSMSDGKLLCKHLGIEYQKININSAFNSILNTQVIFDKKSEKLKNITSENGMGNIMARLRMIFLFDYSANNRYLVGGTSNKTEILLGYGTIYGDMACSLMPIGDLYKSQVRQLSLYMGLPKRIIEKPPSAELKPGQTDEEDLGYSYYELDRVLYNIVDKEKGYDELLELGFSEEIIEFCFDRIDDMIYKSQMPPLVKIN